uniref:Uncharacterized protein n=1 Tax=Aegilops tauschii subsp. strangulata TaxID=200361 RepID=A0A453HCC2_AEGTS
TAQWLIPGQAHEGASRSKTLEKPQARPGQTVWSLCRRGERVPAMEEAAEERAAAPGAAELEDAAENGTEGEGGSAPAAEEDAAAAAAAAYSWPELRFDLPPRRRYHFADQFRSPCSSSAGNFLKGVKWSPDGSSFLTSSDDNSLRMFYLPEDAYSAAAEHTAEAAVGGQDSYGASLQVNEGEPVYDFCWYPYMSVSDPATCVFASTSRDHPIHLWDATTSEVELVAYALFRLVYG